MSIAYSNSPALRLQIADSPLSRLTFSFLIVIAFGTVWLAAARGYPLLACGLLPFLAFLCWGLRRVPQQGAELTWSKGQWQVSCEGGVKPIELTAGAVALPWVVYFPYRCSRQRRRCLWVFVDSVATEEWRRLRVRIRLPDPGPGARW